MPGAFLISRFSRVLTFVGLAGTLIASLSGAASLSGLARAAPLANPTFTVNSFADIVAASPLNDGICATGYNNGQPNGTCTLRAAVMKANHWPGGSATIHLPALPAGVEYTLTIAASGPDDETNGDLNINATITILGGGALHTIINANGNVINDRAFIVYGTLNLSGVTIEGGVANAFGYGGAIRNQGTLTVISSTIRSNQSNYGGGGIANLGVSVFILDSALIGNVATGIGGGLDDHGGPTAVVNSTISDNSATLDGGGLGDTDGGTLQLFNDTVADNRADADLNGSGTGGGIANLTSTVQIQNTIVADNLASDFDVERGYFFVPDDCSGSPTSLDNNLVTETSGCGLVPAANDKTNVAADLGPLQDNGGPTWTRALLPGSPAIDAGHLGGCTDNFGATLATDQRGFPRTANGAGTARCDIGAFERQRLLSLPLIVR